MIKGGHLRFANWKVSVGGHRLAHHAQCLKTYEAPMNPTVQFFRAACSLNADETALIVVRFYSVTSRRSRWTDLLQSAFLSEPEPYLIPLTVCA